MPEPFENQFPQRVGWIAKEVTFDPSQPQACQTHHPQSIVQDSVCLHHTYLILAEVQRVLNQVCTYAFECAWCLSNVFISWESFRGKLAFVN